jgi:hypothetical protein
LLTDIREQIAALPSYGYRRACALVNRQRARVGAARVNPKRAYRVMASSGLLLPRAPRRRQSSRPHEGSVPIGSRTADPAGLRRRTRFPDRRQSPPVISSLHAGGWM